MFRDVAFGQYYPAKSFVHRMDPRVKILLNLLYMITIFSCSPISDTRLCLRICLSAFLRPESP